MHIMYVTPEDIKKIEEFQGIRCSISGANLFYRSGPLTLQIPQGNNFFLFLYFYIVLRNYHCYYCYYPVKSKC